MENRTAIPVLCDRCRAEGIAAEPPFADLGALLDFTPVPRKTARSDGWNAECQRAFVVALAATGSRRRAAHAVGKAQFGVDQLSRCEGSEGFRAACDSAMEIWEETRRRRLADGIGAVADEARAWTPPRGPWSGARSHAHVQPRPVPPSDDETEEARLEWLAVIVRKYLIKVQQEREERLAGRIVAADFSVRQLTCLEVALDLMGGGGFQALIDFRAGGHDLVQIAETPMSYLLGQARRQKWAELGEPARPELPPRHFLVERDGFSIEPCEYTEGGLPLSHEEQRRVFDERHERDAAAQLEWEANARAEAAAWRARVEAEAASEPPAPAPARRPSDGAEG